MINTPKDAVTAFCKIIFNLQALELSLSTDIINLINKDIDDYTILYNAEKRCDFSSIIQEYKSLFISKKCLDVSADGFKDNNLDVDWNNAYFEKIISEIKKVDNNIQKESIYWLKQIIDCRFWTSKNIAYIINYSAVFANSMVNTKIEGTNNSVSQLQKQVESSETNIQNISEEIRDAQAKIDGVVTSTNNLIPNMLTTLGIFITIVVTIIALYISNVLGTSKLEFAIPQMRYARYILSGQITFNCIFFLLYFIAKLTGRTIHLSRMSTEKSLAVSQLDTISASFYYNPLIWITNMLIIISYFLLFDWWLCDEYIWPQIEVLINWTSGSVNWVAFWFAIISIIIVTAIPLCVVILIYSQTSKKLAKIQEKS